MTKSLRKLAESRGRRPINLTPKDIDLFWRFVKSGKPDECWIWQGNKSSSGYGNMRIAGIIFPSHRISLHIKLNINQTELFACHTCDNPPCVNPAHIYAGTPGQNQLDIVRRNRHSGANKTHCKRGHEFTESSTYTRAGKVVVNRVCKACRNIHKKAYNKRKQMLERI